VGGWFFRSTEVGKKAAGFRQSKYQAPKKPAFEGAWDLRRNAERFDRHLKEKGRTAVRPCIIELQHFSSMASLKP